MKIEFFSLDICLPKKKGYYLVRGHFDNEELVTKCRVAFWDNHQWHLGPSVELDETDGLPGCECIRFWAVCPMCSFGLILQEDMADDSNHSAS